MNPVTLLISSNHLQVLVHLQEQTGGDASERSNGADTHTHVLAQTDVGPVQIAPNLHIWPSPPGPSAKLGCSDDAVPAAARSAANPTPEDQPQDLSWPNGTMVLDQPS